MKALLTLLLFPLLIYAQRDGTIPPRQRNVENAILLTIFVPGGGHYYNSQPLTGLMYNSIEYSCLPFVFNYIVKKRKKNEAAHELDISGGMNWEAIEKYQEALSAFCSAKRLRNTWFIISGTAWIVDIFHVGIYTSRYNKGILKYPPKPRKKVSLSPVYEPASNQVGLLLTCNF